MPSEATLHWQALNREGVVPDLYRVFGEFQAFMTPRVGAGLTHRALRELADVIGLPTWVITPKMVSMMVCEFRPRGRREWNDEREFVSDAMSDFWVDITCWVDHAAPKRRKEIETALERCFSQIRSESRLLNPPPRKRKRRGK